MESFGTYDLPAAAPALAAACQIGLHFGLDLSDHRARTVASHDLSRADVVLGFEPEHAHYAVVYARAQRERAFMLREVVSLLEGVEPIETNDVVVRAREIVAAASARRASIFGAQFVPIGDPIGQPWHVYREIAEQIRALSIALVEAIFDVPNTTRSSTSPGFNADRRPRTQLPSW